MPPVKKALIFLALLALFYTLLVIPWPHWPQAYAALYRAGGELLFHSFGSRGTVEFRRPTPPAEFGDTELVLTTRSPRMTTTLPVSSRQKGYLPTATLLALVLATPIPGRRRWWALLWGLLAVNAFVVLRTGLAILNAFVNQGPAAASISPFWREALKGCTFALVEAPASYFIVPILIWVAVSLRREDWVAAGAARRYITGRKPGPPRDGAGR